MHSARKPISYINLIEVFINVPVPAHIVARLIHINLYRYGKDREKDVTRIRLSAATLRTLTGRQRLREAFLNEIEDELFELGWLFLRVEDATFAVIAKHSVDNWPRLSAKRVKDLFGAEEETIDEVYRESLPSLPPEESIDDE